MTITVRCLNGAEANAALAAVCGWQVPQVLAYHSPVYQDMLGAILRDRLCCLAAIDQTGTLKGVLPFRRVETRVGDVLNAFPFFGCNGLVVHRQDAPEAEAMMLGAFRDSAREEGVFSATLYSPFGVNPGAWLKILQPDDIVVKFTQSIDLNEVAEWPAKRKSDLRRAARRQFHVRDAMPTDADAIAAIYAEACLRVGIPPKPRSFIDCTLGRSGSLRWLVLERNGRLVAGLLFGLGPLTASYILPFACHDERRYQPIAWLLDQAISVARSRRIRYWNFESSPEWGGSVFKYKERWQARAMPYAVLTLYGADAQRPSDDQVLAAKADCPFYFVAPCRPVSGAWPKDIDLPPQFNGLSIYL